MTMKLCTVNEVPVGSARGFSAGNVPVLVVHPRPGMLAVYINRCPHLGVPLHWENDSFLDPEGIFIRCATHGAMFEQETGLCVLGPCRGESLWQLTCTILDDAIYLDASELPERSTAGQTVPVHQV